ncbi:lysophospholipid acyltransferase family protein [Acinetobacter chinensis]|uniref:Lysophospholipid acyltransferase family protein n=1 Tax=Acinetobacter chinensis TaxID=2004650 RepID=A0ABU3WJ00_9GAMM|nr:lysophospholipid acyltransferase family protein [Acinetobacter chinensis]MDV2469857.1 lysophospholipid acyltransferase family protein [Acinetobacter chinensis]
MSLLSIFRFTPMPALRAVARTAASIINSQKDKGMLWKSRVNIALCYPTLSTDEQEQLSRSSVVHQCLSYAESLKCWAMPTEWNIRQIKNVHNLSTLQDALNDPKGALIITPHLGNWEIMNPWVHQYGTPTIMYKPMDNPTMETFVRKARERLNTTMVPTDANGVKALFKNLKQGGFSVILPDHVPQPSGGIPSPFFGIPTLTSTLSSKIAQKTHCRLISMICLRRAENDGFDIYIEDIGTEAMYSRDTETAVAELNLAIEKMINRCPEQYMWGYKRFRGTAETRNLYNMSIDELRSVSI